VIRSELTVRRALRESIRLSRSRHWLARVVVASWALHIPLVAFLAPESLSGRALERTGAIGFGMMLAVGVLAAVALVDSAINDMMPARFTSCLMYYRHIGYMALAGVLVITGGGIAVTTDTSVVLASFLLPALFCVVVTVADLLSRSRRQ
jgi:hypothetical protein